MSTWQLGEDIRNSPLFTSAVSHIASKSAADSLSSIDAQESGVSLRWNRILFCASAVTPEMSEAAQEAALRVLHGCVTSNTAEQHQREAAALLLERMGNAPAARLAESRDLIEAESEDWAPFIFVADLGRRRLELSIPLASGALLSANEFQRDFWDEAQSKQWVSVSAPTSAGKSFIVKRWFEERILTAAALQCAYIVPTRALIDEVSNELRQDPSFERVGIHTMPWDPEIGHSPHEIFVVTQERMHILQQRTTSFTPALVFVDEAHKFGDNSRGVLLERVLHECVVRDPTTQVLFASPSAENPEILLNAAPPEARRASVTSRSATVNQNLLWANQVHRKPQLWDLQIVLGEREYPVGQFRLPWRPSPDSKRLPYVAAALGRDKGGNLVYADGAAAAEKAALQIYEALGAGQLEQDPELLALKELVQATIHPRYALAKVITRGVAFHYGNMPLIVRAEVERLFRSGKVQFLVCTSTLLEGVNLPCRTIYARGPRKGKGRVMSTDDFWNLAGRAGRWGKEFQGNIVCVDTSVERLWPEVPRRRERRPIRIASSEVYSQVSRLAAFVSRRTPVEESREWPLGESVVSLLAHQIMHERALSTMSSVDHDSLEPALAAIREKLTEIDIPNQVLARHAGISPWGMQRMVGYLRRYKPQGDLELTTPESTDAVRAYVGALGRCANELGAPFGGPARQIQLALLLVDWMRGYPLSRLIQRRIKVEQDRGRPYKLAAVIRATMTDVEEIARFQAPKYLSCYVDLVRHARGDESSQEGPSFEDISMMLELGVSRVTEMSLMSLGLSRTSTISLSEYIAEDDLTPTGCLEWLERADLDGLGLPTLIRAEIHTVAESETGRGMRSA